MLRRIVVVLFAVALTSCGAGDVRTLTERFEIVDPVTQVQVRSSTGPITVLGFDRQTVSVRADLRFRGGEPEVQREVADRRLLLGGACMGVASRCTAAFALRTPSTVAAVVESGAGQLSVAGLSGAVQTRSGAGDQQLDDLGGPVVAETGEGDVTARALRARDVRVTTGSGDVELRFAIAPAQVVVETGAGDVILRLPTDKAYAVQIEATSSRVDEGVVVDERSRNRITVRTGEGSVTLIAAGRR